MKILTRLALSAATIAILLITACTERLDAPSIPLVDEIRVITNHDKEIAHETNPEIIRQVRDLANSYSDNWGRPWYGAPIAKQMIKFYYQGKFISGFGLGSNFFTRGSLGYYSRPAKTNEVEEFRTILGLPNPGE